MSQVCNNILITSYHITSHHIAWHCMASHSSLRHVFLRHILENECCELMQALHCLLIVTFLHLLAFPCTVFPVSFMWPLAGAKFIGALTSSNTLSVESPTFSESMRRAFPFQQKKVFDLRRSRVSSSCVGTHILRPSGPNSRSFPISSVYFGHLYLFVIFSTHLWCWWFHCWWLVLSFASLLSCE